ncbi:acetolactate synthase small subunit [Desulfobulbus rhabdoformis]|uniref:acetolactate synthase small subunit n=1 Tax=Desulfobulbus rhabdoformis TaxID=34032 RepID=UPI0023DD5B78|nr:acetolactate synthase small subunit [Desulfobulbus rhabdoformis]
MENTLMNTTILRLLVNNHPGVMSQICGLFARRAFNMEGIFCNATGQGDTSCIWLKVDETDRLDQVVKQLAKLEDVISIEERNDAQPKIQEMEAMMERVA